MCSRLGGVGMLRADLHNLHLLDADELSIDDSGH